MIHLKPPLPRLLVFDLDGTLIDSSLDLCHAVNAALEHVDRPRLPEARIASFVGDGAGTLVRRALVDTAEAGTDSEPLFEAALAHFLEFYRLHKLDNTVTYPGVLEALGAIRQAHPSLPMAVLTNKPVYPSREICDALGLSPFFFVNYGGNSFATKKPDPEGLLTILEESKAHLRADEAPIQPAEAVLIGDSHVDVLTARAAGFRSLGCTYGLAPAALLAASPDGLVDAPSEWGPALGLTESTGATSAHPTR